MLNSPETGNPNPEIQREQINYLKKLPRVDLEEEHKGFLLHGTSVFALTLGKLTGRTFREEGASDFSPQEGDLYVIDSRDIAALEDVSFHAGVAARSHFILDKLDVDFGDPEYSKAVREIISVPSLTSVKDIPFNRDTEKLYKLLFTERMMNPDAFIRLVRESLAWKGVILALDPVLKSPAYNFREGDDTFDYRISVPRGGLPLEFIKGLTPLGEKDEEYLDKVFQAVSD